MSIKRLCCCPGCVRFRDGESRWCAVHRPKYEAEDKERYVNYLEGRQHTQSRAYDFYRSADWKNLSKRLLRERVWCEICGMNYATDVHHRLPAADYPELALDEDNLMCVCKSCHSKITDEERKLRSRRRKENE